MNEPTIVRSFLPAIPSIAAIFYDELYCPEKSNRKAMIKSKISHSGHEILFNLFVLLDENPRQYDIRLHIILVKTEKVL